MTARFFSLGFIAIIIIGGSIHCSFGDKSRPVETKTVTSEDAGGLTGAIIKNDIDLEATGVKVSAAYLMNEDREYMESNNAGIGQKVILTIKLDTGWTKINGRSFLGASERVTDANGVVVLDAPDLFEEYIDGLPANIAQLINITAVITRNNPGVDKYTVSFKAWDKKGRGVVQGKYKLQIK